MFWEETGHGSLETSGNSENLFRYLYSNFEHLGREMVSSFFKGYPEVVKMVHKTRVFICDDWESLRLNIGPETSMSFEDFRHIADFEIMLLEASNREIVDVNFIMGMERDRDTGQRHIYSNTFVIYHCPKEE